MAGLVPYYCSYKLLSLCGCQGAYTSPAKVAYTFYALYSVLTAIQSQLHAVLQYMNPKSDLGS